MAQSGSGTLAGAEPALYFLASGLDSTGTAPWAYAMLARTIMSHIRGDATLDAVPQARKLNHFHLASFLAARDPANFPPGRWEQEFRQLALDHPCDQPLPIPA